MTDENQNALSRRRLLAGIGVSTAGAVTLGAGHGIAEAAPEAGVSVPADRFGRMFPNLPAFAPATNQVRAAMSDIGKRGGILDARDPLERGPIDLIIDPALSVNNRDNPFHTAGTTFLGQFLDHDMTFDTTSPLGVPTAPETSVNARTPALDLDSVYGGGPISQPSLYNPADRAKFRIEFGGLFEDLPRAADRTAIIAEPRNDENLIISGLHAAFLLFHNRVVDLLRSQGVPESELFTRARRTVTWHYQWIIVNEFLRQLCGYGIITDVLAHGRRFYKPEPGPAFIPVEFQGAVYRVGHTMIRPSYRANLAGDLGKAFFGFIFDPTQEGSPDPGDLRGRARAPRRFIGWQTFFDFGDGQMRPNKRMDRRISTPLFQLPLSAIPSGDNPTSLPQRNLLRHITWSLPSGQDIARAMGIPTLDASQLPELAGYGLGLDRSTPLWYYTLAESELIGDGIVLGPMSARLVAEVFVGLLQRDPNSYLAVQPSWRPTLPSSRPGEFAMVDLLRFARVDPASRGQ
ncbi:MAG TPA: peroxidase [Micromonosporaceae bacterium]|nr:peroxidase [Micromonosporaceae bacterium]